MAKTREERIKDLIAQEQKLKERRKQLEAQESQARRKKENHIKIILGAHLLKMLNEEFSEIDLHNMTDKQIGNIASRCVEKLRQQKATGYFTISLPDDETN
ncbi:MAG: hypothetical protein K6F77_01040 [Lachnospiraceae bacterium]|nr:hypothetical protein [Lachnospiraceae bacterium]